LNFSRPQSRWGPMLTGNETADTWSKGKIEERRDRTPPSENPTRIQAETRHEHWLRITAERWCRSGGQTQSCHLHVRTVLSTNIAPSRPGRQTQRTFSVLPWVRMNTWTPVHKNEHSANVHVLSVLFYPVVHSMSTIGSWFARKCSVSTFLKHPSALNCPSSQVEFVWELISCT
jgi:hypothetical protein